MRLISFFFLFVPFAKVARLAWTTTAPWPTCKTVKINVILCARKIRHGTKWLIMLLESELMRFDLCSHHVLYNARVVAPSYYLAAPFLAARFFFPGPFWLRFAAA